MTRGRQIGSVTTLVRRAPSASGRGAGARGSRSIRAPLFMKHHRPDFLIIGAMKSATTTLPEQLARQPGVFMPRPTEPNFFSDDDVFARGLDWYGSLYRGAEPPALRGESSTHYTKRPTYPNTVRRMADALPGL